jgi:DNA primase catalytic subunit
MDIRAVQEYYSREDVQNAMLETARNREVVGVFRSGAFGSRPNVVMYPQDIIAMVKSGVLEFHSSLERWSNPMGLRSDNYEGLRIGWDLILDIDCKGFDHAKMTANIVIDALRKHRIRNCSVKYTGGKGFHIGVPWESIPKTVDYKPSVSMFPELARNMGLYLKGFIREELGAAFLRKYDPEKLAEQAGKPLGKVLVDDNIDPFQIVEIDPVLISPRHLFRMPYSLNRNTGLVSLPIKADNITGFEKEFAHPDMVRVREGFLDRGAPGEADILVAEASDWWAKRKVAERRKLQRKLAFSRAVPQEFFPPCIKNIKPGVLDGRKRSVFILINFLSSLKWNRENMEKFILEWNQKNRPPLPENYVRGQLRWHRNSGKVILPPNCAKEGFYESFGVCRPDSFCGADKSVKNPVNYPFRKMGKDRGKAGGKARGKK